jgi:hypothetical protein
MTLSAELQRCRGLSEGDAVSSEQTPHGSEKPIACATGFFFGCAPLLLLSKPNPLTLGFGFGEGT